MKKIFSILIFTLNLPLLFAQAPEQAPIANQEPGESAPAEPASILEIKQLGTEEPLYSLELREVELSDLFKVLAHDYNLNILVDKEVSGKVSASFSNISLEEALQGIAQISNLRLEKRGNLTVVEPNLITKIFSLKYIEAKSLTESSEGGSSSAQSPSASQSSSASSQNTTAASGASNATTASGSSTAGASSSSQTAEQNTIYDLLSDKGKILLGKQSNSLVVIDYPPYVEEIEAYLKEVDQKMATRVFKLKYLKATNVVGRGSTNAASTSAANTSYGGNTTAAPGS